MVGLLTCYWIPVTFPHLPGGYQRQTLFVGRPYLLDYLLLTVLLIQRAKGERGLEIGPQIPIPLKNTHWGTGVEASKESQFQF